MKMTRLNSFKILSGSCHALILLQLLLITYRVAWGQDDMETVSSRCTPRGKVPPVSFSSTHNAYLFANDEQGVATPNTTWTTIASNQILQENFEFSSLCSLEIVAVIVGHRGPCRITVTATWTLAAGDNVNRQLLKKDVNTCPAVDRQELTALNRSMQLSDISHTQSSNVHVLVGIQNDATAAGRSPHSATSSCSHCQVLTVELRGAVKPRAFLVGQYSAGVSTSPADISTPPASTLSSPRDQKNRWLAIAIGLAAALGLLVLVVLVLCCRRARFRRNAGSAQMLARQYRRSNAFKACTGFVDQEDAGVNPAPHPVGHTPSSTHTESSQNRIARNHRRAEFPSQVRSPPPKYVAILSPDVSRQDAPQDPPPALPNHPQADRASQASAEYRVVHEPDSPLGPAPPPTGHPQADYVRQVSESSEYRIIRESDATDIRRYPGPTPPPRSPVNLMQARPYALRTLITTAELRS